jgi:hypothetical protein
MVGDGRTEQTIGLVILAILAIDCVLLRMKSWMNYVFTEGH